MKFDFKLDELPENAKAYMGMCMAMTTARASVDMMLGLFEKHDVLQDNIPGQWPFHLSLDELSAEISECIWRYQDMAVTEIAKGILDRMKVFIDETEGKTNGTP